MVIEADGLSRAYGRQLAVDGVSFRVTRGEVVGFLGPNGAGKSTTLRMLAGLIRPDKGVARIAGHDAARSRMAAQARLGYMPEAASGFSDLTVSDFLAYCAEARGCRGRRRRAMIADVAAINHVKSGKLKNAGYAAVFTFFQKTSISIGLIFVGWLIGLAGIQSGADEQTAEAARNIAIMTFLAPPVVICAALLILRRYPIDRAYMEDIREQTKVMEAADQEAQSKETDRSGD